MPFSGSPNKFIRDVPPPPAPAHPEDWRAWATDLLMKNHEQHEDIKESLHRIGIILQDRVTERRILSWILTPSVILMWIRWAWEAFK